MTLSSRKLKSRLECRVAGVAAHELWPGRRAIGEKITVNSEWTVIGVMGNVRHSSLEEAGGNEMYLDFRQCGDWTTMEMVVRSTRTAACIFFAAVSAPLTGCRTLDVLHLAAAKLGVQSPPKAPAEFLY